MEQWRKLRGFIQSHGLIDDLERLGIDVAAFDSIFQRDIEEVLCGVTEELLNAEFPQLIEDLRLMFTRPYQDIPSLRIAFRVDPEDGKIETCGCSIGPDSLLD